jgi:hypothetical protein
MLGATNLHISLLKGAEYEYFFFMTNTEFPSEKVVISYEKRGNAENYIKYPEVAQGSQV